MKLIMDLGAPSPGHAKRIRLACPRLPSVLVGYVKRSCRHSSLLMRVKIFLITSHSPTWVEFSLWRPHKRHMDPHAGLIPLSRVTRALYIICLKYHIVHVINVVRVAILYHMRIPCSLRLTADIYQPIRDIDDGIFYGIRGVGVAA
jgi:hypothetical protein